MWDLKSYLFTVINVGFLPSIGEISDVVLKFSFSSLHLSFVNKTKTVWMKYLKRVTEHREF